jgi:hypothetical protein
MLPRNFFPPWIWDEYFSGSGMNYLFFLLVRLAPETIRSNHSSFYGGSGIKKILGSCSGIWYLE